MSEEAEQSLAKVKPLFDPLRVLTTFGAVFAGVQLLGGFFLLLSSVLLLSRVPLEVLSSVRLEGLSLIGGAFYSAAITILIDPRIATNAFYLRSFRTDLQTAKLRGVLAAILGPDFRLSGIRPPRERTTAFVRFFAPGFFALRYAGTKYMELEAGDDWMARLWKSYSLARVAFIDVRDVTTHVEAEIRLTTRALGEDRCIFLTDERHTAQEWEGLLKTIIGSEAGSAPLKLLDTRLGEQWSTRIASQLQPMLASLPVGTAGERPAGRAFVLAHVSEASLSQARRFFAARAFAAIFAIVCSVGVAVAPRPVLVPLAFVALPIMALLLLNAYWRFAQRAWRLGRFGQSSAASWAAFAVSLLLGLASPVLFSMRALSKMAGYSEEAKVVAAQAQVADFKLALDSFEMENGFYPKSLADLVEAPAGAQNWRGPYLKRIPPDPWGHALRLRNPGQTPPCTLRLDVARSGRPHGHRRRYHFLAAG